MQKSPPEQIILLPGLRSSLCCWRYCYLGDLCIVSDCSHVVYTFKWLARHGFNPALLAKLDNADLWAVISAVLVTRGGDVTVSKVKAHVSGSCPAQDPWVTKHNEAADELAKAAARELWLTKYNALLGEVSQGLDLQSHLIVSLVKRPNCLQIPFDEGKGNSSTGGIVRVSQYDVFDSNVVGAKEIALSVMLPW